MGRVYILNRGKRGNIGVRTPSPSFSVLDKLLTEPVTGPRAQNFCHLLPVGHHFPKNHKVNFSFSSPLFSAQMNKHSMTSKHLKNIIQILQNRSVQGDRFYNRGFFFFLFAKQITAASCNVPEICPNPNSLFIALRNNSYISRHTCKFT